jgi:hypothetical protein
LADDSFALGFLVGILIIIGPQLTLYIFKLRRQVGFLKGPQDTEFPVQKEKPK